MQYISEKKWQSGKEMRSFCCFGLAFARVAFFSFFSFGCQICENALIVRALAEYSSSSSPTYV